MDIYKTSLFKFVSGDMVKDRPATMTIEGVEVSEMPNLKTGEVEQKYLLTFKESKKPLILNSTNAKFLAKEFGRDTERWAGQVVELYAEEVKAFGKLHNAARIRESKAAKVQQQAVARATASTPEERRRRRQQNNGLLHSDQAPIGEEPAAPAEMIRATDIFAPIIPGEAGGEGAEK